MIMKKINIAELLKDCPKGMELDCTMYDDVYFDYVDELNIIHCYIQYETHRTSITLSQHGTPNSDIKSKCVIFPKGKTSWEGFHRPFVEGDIVSTESGIYIGIVKSTEDSHRCHTFCSTNDKGEFIENIDFLFSRFATEKEKEKLFQAIKDNGYRWNPETKNLEKLVVNDSKFKVGAKVLNKNGGIFEVIKILGDKNRYLCASCRSAGIGVHQVYDEEDLQLYEPTKPEFNVGDKIRRRGGTRLITIKDIRDNYYIVAVPSYFDNAYTTDKLLFSNQNEYKLVPDKFDINTLIPFESRVLVRDNDKEKWHPGIWGYYDSDSQDYPYKLIGDISRYCIPYEGNEHLMGKTDDCDEYFKSWK